MGSSPVLKLLVAMLLLILALGALKLAKIFLLSVLTLLMRLWAYAMDCVCVYKHMHDLRVTSKNSTAWLTFRAASVVMI